MARTLIKDVLHTIDFIAAVNSNTKLNHLRQVFKMKVRKHEMKGSSDDKNP